jgi:uncharacterized protein YecE (DUF72 family)
MAKATKHTLFYGTSSWSEPSWTGSFYPEGIKATDMLGHYARRFRAVEADTTYYGIPNEKTVKGWAEKTPDGFRMCAKFPRTIVHGGDAAVPDPRKLLVWEHVAAQTEEFLAVMGLLGAKCGPLVLQFPYFNKQAFATDGQFLERLDAYLARLPGSFRYGVEVRNKYWLKPALTRLLARHRVGLVLVDLAYMPLPDELPSRLDLLTTDFAYVRLIGDRKAIDAMTTTFDRTVVDQGQRLTRWSKLLRGFMERVPQTWVFANNHYAGFGPATIEALVSMLGGEAA